VLALTVTAQQPHAVTVGDEPQRIVSIARVVAGFATVPLVADGFPADLPLSWLRHDAT
jgi:hypothetical protein